MPEWAWSVLAVVGVLSPVLLLIGWRMYTERRDHARLKAYMDDLCIDKER